MITVAGGVYLETCLDPDWQMVFGSGGRAAAGLASLVEGVRLHSYASPEIAPEAEALAATSGFDVALAGAPQTISFDYLHCMSNPVISPHPERIKLQSPLEIESEVVLRFGFMEGDARVVGSRVVYDPQSPIAPQAFSANGSQAEHLAIVANETEVRQLGRSSNWEAAAVQVLLSERADVVIVKRGSHGALVVTKNKQMCVPAYAMDHVFTIGSGDIFSAAFAYFWGLKGLDPFEAGDLASRSSALYCHSQSHCLKDSSYLRQTVTKVVRGLPDNHKVYLAGPFFNLPQRWLVEEARNQLHAQGLKVFSPLHDVGLGGTPAALAAEDLNALVACDRVLALLDGADPGTVFEVGYARSKGIPVIAFTQQLTGEPLTMIEGTGCEVVRDFASAIYRTSWVGRLG